MGQLVVDMFAAFRSAARDPERVTLEELQKLDDDVDLLQEYVLVYLGKIRQLELTEQQSDEIERLMIATNEIESLGDMMTDGLVPVAIKIVDRELTLSETAEHMLDDLYAKLCQALEVAVAAVREADERKAQDVRAMKGEIQHLVDQALARQARSALAEGPKELAAFRLEVELVTLLAGHSEVVDGQALHDVGFEQVSVAPDMDVVAIGGVVAVDDPNLDEVGVGNGAEATIDLIGVADERHVDAVDVRPVGQVDHIGAVGQQHGEQERHHAASDEPPALGHQECSSSSWSALAASVWTCESQSSASKPSSRPIAPARYRSTTPWRMHASRHVAKAWWYPTVSIERPDASA